MKLYLHSSKASNNIFTLDQTINGSWKLLHFSATNNLFNVNDTNNKIYFNDGTDKTATLVTDTMI